MGTVYLHFARELVFAVSTVNTIVKDTALIKEHMKGTAVMKSLITTKKCEGVRCKSY